MICKTCGMMYGTLVCPGCAETKSRAAYREYQLHPLREFAEHRIKLTTRAIDGVWHLQMFGCQRTFCHRAVESHYRRGALDVDEFSRLITRSSPALAVELPLGEYVYCAPCCDEAMKLMSEALPCSE